jgi:hypothetical protein
MAGLETKVIDPVLYRSAGAARGKAAAWAFEHDLTAI